MSTTDTYDSSAQLADYGTMLRRRLPLILLCILIGAAVGLAATLLMHKKYQSTASVIVRPVSVDATDSSSSSSSKSSSTTVDLDTEAQLVKSSVVLDLVKRAVPGLPATPEIASNITVTVPPNSQVLTVTYTAGSASAAQTDANAVANGYLQYKRTAAQTQVNQQLKSLNDQLTNLNQLLEDTASRVTALPATAPSRSFLQSQQAVLSTSIQNTSTSITRLKSLTIDPGELIAPAVRPSKPTSPSLPINLLAGLMAGLLVGVGLAVLRERSDRRLRNRRDLERGYGLPVLAELPRLRRREGEALLAPDSPGGEGIRRLRNSVIAAPTEPDSGRVIVVTSASPGGAASAVAANLAAALGYTGARTVLVCADLGENAAYRFFPVSQQPGLSELLAGRAQLKDATRSLTDPPLNVVPPGRPGPASVDLLRGGHLAAILNLLRKHSDFVIVEAPPISQAADAQGIAALSDSVIPVISLGSTTKDEVEALNHDLTQVHAHVLGSVVLQGEWPREGRRPGHGNASSGAADTDGRTTASAAGSPLDEQRTAPGEALPAAADGAPSSGAPAAGAPAAGASSGTGATRVGFEPGVPASPVARSGPARDA